MKKKGVVAKKVGMTRIFDDNGFPIPVTVLYIVPQFVVEKKKYEEYEAVKVAYDEKKIKNAKKPILGILKKAGIEDKYYSRFVEFKVEDTKEVEVGKDISLDLLKNVDKVSVIGYTKGRGFASAIKRHNFSRGPETHGSKNVRKLGSTGQSTYPANVIKGKRMPGHYGNERVTIKNLKVVSVEPDERLLLVKGAVPGANGNYVFVTFK